MKTDEDYRNEGLRKARFDCLQEAVKLHMSNSSPKDGETVLATARLFNDFVKGTMTNG